SYYGLGTLARQDKDAKSADDYFRQALTIGEKLLRLDPSNARHQAEMMLARAAVGEHTRAVEFAAKLRANKNVDAEMLVDMARAYALCSVAEAASTGERGTYTAQALEVLRLAVAQGYKNAKALKESSDLEPIKQHPEFVEILK